MLLFRVLVICIGIIITGITNQWFCTSGSTNTGSTNVITKSDNESPSHTGVDIDEKSPKIQAIEKNLQKLILEFAKIQGNNSLKNIGQSFKKINPDSKSIISTYSGLQWQFSRIKNNIIEEGLEDSVRGDIIIPYCEYMIEAIEKKKENLE